MIQTQTTHINFDLKNKSGIYKISNTIHDRIYIGSAKSLYDRFHTHKHYFKKNEHHSLKLQRFVNKYGFDKLIFSVLEFCSTEDLIIREQFWLDKHQPFYNTCKLAGNTLGVKPSAKVKQHLSEIRKGKYPEHLRGFNKTEAVRKKIGDKARARGMHPNFLSASIAANTGRKHSEEQIMKRILKQVKINREQAIYIIKSNKNGVRQIDLAKQFNVSQRVICRVINGIGIYNSYQK